MDHDADEGYDQRQRKDNWPEAWFGRQFLLPYLQRNLRALFRRLFRRLFILSRLFCHVFPLFQTPGNREEPARGQNLVRLREA